MPNLSYELIFKKLNENDCYITKIMNIRWECVHKKSDPYLNQWPRKSHKLTDIYNFKVASLLKSICL